MKWLIAIVLMGQVIMAAVIESIEVDGVTVPFVYEQESNLPIVSMEVVFQNSGSEKNGKHYGLAEMAAKMFGEGTESLGSIKFANKLDAKAINLSANAGMETFVFDMSSLKEQFSDGVALFAQLISEPNLSEESLKKTKAVTVGNIKRKENDYDYVASLLLKEELFAKTPIAHPSVGTLQSIDAMSLKEIETFVAKHIVLERAIVVIGGDISKEDAKKSAKEVLSKLKHGSKGELEYYKANDAKKERIEKKETEQAYIYFGSPFDMKVDSPEYYKARVATFILGAGGFGSRMMEEIRVKRGLAYSAYARVSVNKSYSYFVGYLQTKLESQKEAKDAVVELIDTFVKKGATQEELEQAKKFLLGSEPLRTETLSQRLSRTYMEYYKGLPLGSYQKELENIEKLTLDELNAFIKEHNEILDLSFAIITK